MNRKTPILITETETEATALLDLLQSDPAFDGVHFDRALFSEASAEELSNYDAIFCFGEASFFQGENRIRLDLLEEALLKSEREIHEINLLCEKTGQYIYEVLNGKFNSFAFAEQMIASMDLSDCFHVILVDCDRTLSNGSDSTELAIRQKQQDLSELRRIYANDCFTNYQSFLAMEYYRRASIFTEECLHFVRSHLQLNFPLIEDLKRQRFVKIVPITAGNAALWEQMLQEQELFVRIPSLSGIMSKYIKYAVCKAIMKLGIYVTAIGDSALDIFMVKQANKGYFITNKGPRDYIHRTFAACEHIHQLAYCTYLYPDIPVDPGIGSITCMQYCKPKLQPDIANCYTAAQVFGRTLRESHRRIGIAMAEQIRADFPSDCFTVVVVMRSGLPMGMAIADTLDCPIVFYTPGDNEQLNKYLQQIPAIEDHVLILCDAVVNSGATLSDLFRALSQYRCISAINVFSAEGRVRFTGPLYLGRLSEKKAFSRQERISFGIDTSAKLFEKSSFNP